MQSCFSPIASASAAAPEPDCGIRFHCCSQFASASSCCSPIAHASAAARRLRPLQLLLPIASASAATPPIASASTAAPRLRPLQLLLARLRPLQLLLPDCVRFNCCSPASTAAPRLHTSAAFWIPPHARVQCSRTFFAEFEVQ